MEVIDLYESVICRKLVAEGSGTDDRPWLYSEAKMKVREAEIAQTKINMMADIEAKKEVVSRT